MEQVRGACPGNKVELRDRGIFLKTSLECLDPPVPEDMVWFFLLVQESNLVFGVSHFELVFLSLIA